MAITLYGYGPAFGLPDPSPFVTKVELLLKMSGLPFRTALGDPRKAPEGKLPWLDDGGVIVSDSTLIRWHLEERHGIDLDAGYGPQDRALGWTIERMLGEQLYWPVLHDRWMDDANFARGPAHFFDAVPVPLRQVVRALVRRKVKAALHAQGTGRHRPAEIERLGIRSIDALAELLGDKPFILGDTISGSDATVWAFVAGTLCRHFETKLRTAAERHDNLRTYEARLRARFYSEGRAIRPSSPLRG